MLCCWVVPSPHTTTPHQKKKTPQQNTPAYASCKQVFGAVANIMLLKGSLRRWLPYRLSEVMLFLSRVNWHFPFKTAPLCEWAEGVGCLFFFFKKKTALPQPMASQSCNELQKEFYLTSQKK